MRLVQVEKYVVVLEEILTKNHVSKRKIRGNEGVKYGDLIRTKQAVVCRLFSWK
jgi:hypothetical protein